MSTREDEKADQDAKDSDGTVDVTEADGVEVDEDDKEAAKEMMTAYEDRPTLVLPGSGKTITGTAVNDWIDDDGNPKYADDKDSPAAKAKEQQSENGDGAKAKDETSSDESSEDNSAEDNDAEQNTKSQRGGQSERAAAADENTEDKSPEELKKDAEAAVEENLEKDKAFNEEIIKATKEDRERQNS